MSLPPSIIAIISMFFAAGGEAALIIPSKLRNPHTAPHTHRSPPPISDLKLAPRAYAGHLDAKSIVGITGGSTVLVSIILGILLWRMLKYRKKLKDLKEEAAASVAKNNDIEAQAEQRRRNDRKGLQPDDHRVTELEELGPQHSGGSKLEADVVLTEDGGTQSGEDGAAKR